MADLVQLHTDDCIKPIAAQTVRGKIGLRSISVHFYTRKKLKMPSHDFCLQNIEGGGNEEEGEGIRRGRRRRREKRRRGRRRRERGGGEGKYLLNA